MNKSESKPADVPQTPAVWLTLIAAVASVVIRLIPFGVRPPNVAANGSMGLFGGARTPWWCALPLMLLALIVSDIILWKRSGMQPFDPFVYASFALYLVVGRLLLRRNQSPSRVAAATLIGSTMFFLISNFGYWLGQLGQPHQLHAATPMGLMEAYIVALPFFGFTVVGDLGFTAVLFGAEAWLMGLVKSTREAPVPEEVAS